MIIIPIKSTIVYSKVAWNVFILEMVMRATMHYFLYLVQYTLHANLQIRFLYEDRYDFEITTTSFPLEVALYCIY
jgi:hypothetical protein